MSSQQATNIDTKTATTLLASLTKELTSPTSPATPHTATDTQRGMCQVDAWTPQFNRRQSWSKEEHKHGMQMGRVGDVQTGPGFSERS